MPKFRKRPVVIEAEQYDGSPESVERIRKLAISGTREIRETAEGLVISTLEGDMLARPGDWVVKGVHGELYPVKPDIFQTTYEPAEV